MSWRPFWQYYKGCFPFIFGISFLITVLFGFGWGLFVLVLIAPFIGDLLFGMIRLKEYIFYNNLGLTRRSLIVKSYIINAMVAIPIGAILFLISLVGGSFRIT